jgi:hypothetical protein
MWNTLGLSARVSKWIWIIAAQYGAHVASPAEEGA